MPICQSLASGGWRQWKVVLNDNVCFELLETAPNFPYLVKIKIELQSQSHSYSTILSQWRGPSVSIESRQHDSENWVTRMTRRHRVYKPCVRTVSQHGKEAPEWIQWLWKIIDTFKVTGVDLITKSWLEQEAQLVYSGGSSCPHHLLPLITGSPVTDYCWSSDSWSLWMLNAGSTWQPPRAPTNTTN